MSVYYKENPIWFRQALDSVFAQTLLPSEIVLVKDGPLTYELDEVIDEYQTKHPIFKIISNEKNIGLGLSLQKGVLACSNEIIARMDSDDTMPIDRFEKELKKINEGYDVVSCWSALYVNNTSNIIAIKTRSETHDDIMKLAKRRSPVCHAACMMRKSAVIAAGNYEHRLYYEDYHLWIRMLMKHATFYNIQEVLYYVRTSQLQLQRRGGMSYLRNELLTLKEFYDWGFYSQKDLLINASIRTVVRLTPMQLRRILFEKIWKAKTV
jgi:glycosyltransferase involved in cell wall biosynthesis